MALRPVPTGWAPEIGLRLSFQMFLRLVMLNSFHWTGSVGFVSRQSATKRCHRRVPLEREAQSRADSRMRWLLTNGGHLPLLRIDTIGVASRSLRIPHAGHSFGMDHWSRIFKPMHSPQLFQRSVLANKKRAVVHKFCIP